MKIEDLPTPPGDGPFRTPAMMADGRKQWEHYIRELESLITTLGMNDFTTDGIEFRDGTLRVLITKNPPRWTLAKGLDAEAAEAFAEMVGKVLLRRWSATDEDSAKRRVANAKLLDVIKSARSRAGTK